MPGTDSRSSEISNQVLLESLLKAIKQEGTTNKEEIKQEIKTENAKIIDKLTENTKRLSELELKQTNLERHVTFCDRQLRKNNIVIFGLEIPDDVELMNFTLSTLKNLLGIKVEQSDINNIYKLSGKETSPIKLELVTYIKKQQLLSNCSKLKGSGVSIAHDLSKEDQENQKILYKNLKLARDNNLSSKISKNSLIVNGKVYSIDQLKFGIPEISQLSPSQQSSTESNTTAGDAAAVNKPAGGPSNTIGSKNRGEDRGRITRNKAQKP